MKIEIKSRWTGSVLFSIETDSWKLAVEPAVKAKANLSGANLYWANLYGAKGITPERSTPLLMLLDQPDPIRAYKLVTEEGIGPFNGGITYKVGKSYRVKDANCDPLEQCGAGINVATLDWCLRNWTDGYKVLIVEFKREDIACIPTATDGKFRLKRCKVIAEKDLSEMFAREKKEQEAWEKEHAKKTTAAEK